MQLSIICKLWLTWEPLSFINRLALLCVTYNKYHYQFSIIIITFHLHKRSTDLYLIKHIKCNHVSNISIISSWQKKEQILTILPEWILLKSAVHVLHSLNERPDNSKWFLPENIKSRLPASNLVDRQISKMAVTLTKRWSPQTLAWVWQKPDSQLLHCSILSGFTSTLLYTFIHLPHFHMQVHTHSLWVTQP